jgi:archaemetzincin
LRLLIQPFGNVPVDIIDALAASLSTFDMDIEIRNSVSIPVDSHDAKRGQYRADAFMEVCAQSDADRVLGVAAVDIFAEPLNFVFGQAEVGGRAAVISIARLAHRDREKFNQRVTKEAIHELGHTFGVTHCPDPKCVMSFSNSLEDTDRKGTSYCDACLEAIPTALRPRRM